MERQPTPLSECVRQWQAYKASIDGKPIPDAKEPLTPDVFEAFGRTVVREMLADPIFLRLVMAKLAGKLF